MTQPASEPFVLLVSDDLFFGSRIEAAAKQAGVAIVTDGTGSLTRIGDDDCLGVLFDLEHKTTDPGRIAAQANGSVIRLVAYGPHVHANLFAVAKAAGFETVTRGQLDRDTVRIMQTFVTA